MPQIWSFSCQTLRIFWYIASGRIFLIQSVCNINVSWQYETNAGSVFNHIINIQIFSRYDSDSCMNWKNISPDTVINIHTTSTRSKGTSPSIFVMFLQVIPILQSIIYLEASLLISLLIYWTGSSWDLVKCLCLSSVWKQLYSTEYLFKKEFFATQNIGWICCHQVFR